MAESDNTKYIYLLYVGAFLGIVLLGYFLYKQFGKKKENYSPMSQKAFVDTYRPTDGNVELVQTSYDMQRNGLDYLSNVDGMETGYNMSREHPSKPGRKFQQLHTPNTMPKLASYQTGFDVDIADPKFYFFGSRQPRVVLKDRVYALADPFRGDIPIKRFNEICMVKDPAKGREAQRFSGTFNPAYDQMMKSYQTAASYDTANIANKNYPGYTSRQQTIHDA